MASVFYVQKPLICCQNIFDKTEILKKIEKSSQTFWNTETYPSCKPQNNGRKCDILKNKPEFLFIGQAFTNTEDIIQPKICHKTDEPQQAECYSNTFFWMKIDFEGRDNEIDMT